MASPRHKSRRPHIDDQKLAEVMAELGHSRHSSNLNQHLFSLSLNPPKGEKVSTKTFEDAVNRAEERLGRKDQPRAVVFPIKDGRRHAHVAWSRISVGGMKAIPMPHFKRKLNTLYLRQCHQ